LGLGWGEHFKTKDNKAAVDVLNIYSVGEIYNLEIVDEKHGEILFIIDHFDFEGMTIRILASNVVDLIMEPRLLKYESFTIRDKDDRAVPVENLPLYVGWPMISLEFEEILKRAVNEK
jgi:hypothetical protein